MQILGGAPQGAQAFTIYACYGTPYDADGNPTFYPDGSLYCFPDPAINGKCSVTHYNCDVGVSANNVSGASSYTWSCLGDDGGTNASCSEAKPVCPADTPYTETDAPSIAQYCAATGVTCGAGQTYVSSISCHTGGTGTWSPYGSACTAANCTGCGCVTIPATAPTASLSASPTSVASGGQSTLTWGSTNATSCTASGPWSNSGTLSGSGLTDPLTSNTTFYFQCTGAGGTSALKSATVSVTAPAGGSSCTLPWGGTIADGASVTAYQSASVTSPATCTSQTRTCSNGTLSGTYTNQSCSVSGSGATGSIAGPNCTIAAGASTCSTTVTWSTSGVTSAQAFQDGSSFSTSLSGSASRTVGYSASTFTLFDRTPSPDVQLDSDNARGNCASGSGWNGTYCELGYLPDLTADNGVTPLTAQPGVSTTLTATIRNIGPLTTGSNFDNFIQIATATNGGGTLTDLGSQSLNSLAAGASNTISRSYTFPSAGTYSARACADKRNRSDDGKINESNEGNNCGGWMDVVVSAPAAPIPTATLSANPTSIYPGATSRLTWSSTNATSCASAGGFSTNNNTSGNVNVTPAVTSVYSVTCTGAGGTSAPAQATVTVILPNLSISAVPNRVARGSSSTISWNATDVKTCSITKNSAAWKSNLKANGSNIVTGSSVETINAQTVYVMSCTDVNGAAYAAVATVIVNIAPDFQEF